MAIQTRLVDYADGDATFEGFMAWDDQISSTRPGVLIAHTVAGRSEFEERRALMLAELGYVGFAIDVYGKATRSSDMDENRDRMTALRADRPLLQSRLHAALMAFRGESEVDDARIAAIGFCFGGLCVLDMARSGEDLCGVVSFHGVLDAPDNTAANRAEAKILVLHGWDDPLAKPDALVSLADELTAMGADWQVHAYGHTMHAFSNPAAKSPADGKHYSESADRRSWTAMRVFLAELFD